MTKRDKIIILSSVLLAICVIASAIPLLIGSYETKVVNVESLLFVGGIIIIGILSVVIVYFSKVRKGKFEKMLNDEYFHEYEIIKDALMNSQLLSNSKKEIKEDVLDMLLSAQKAGKDVKDVIGNPVIFSKDIIYSFAKPVSFTILSLLDGIIGFCLIVIGANILMWLEQIEKSFFGIGFDISMILFFIIIVFVLIPLTKRLTSTQNPWMFLLPLAFGIGYILLAEFLRKYFYYIGTVKTLLDGTVIMIPSITVFMIYLLLILGLMPMKIKVRKQLMRG